MKQVFLISLFLVVVAGRAGALVDVDLTVEREYLPYTAETFSHFMVGRLESGQIGQPGLEERGGHGTSCVAWWSLVERGERGGARGGDRWAAA